MTGKYIQTQRHTDRQTDGQNETRREIKSTHFISERVVERGIVCFNMSLSL